MPISKLCAEIIKRDTKETFLDAILNIWRQWYNNRDDINLMNITRENKFTSYMLFATELFCQIKRSEVLFKRRFEET